MTAKKKPTCALPKKPPVNQPLPEGAIGTKEMAKRLKIEPRRLRTILRATGKGSGGERYIWKESDVEKVKAVVEKFEAAESGNPKNAEASHDDK